VAEPLKTLRGRAGAHAMHSRNDSKAVSQPARDAFMARFEREVDPDRTLDPAERTRRATHARKAYFTRLALKSAKARRRKTVMS
jgi:hypothetical protein